MGLLSYAILIPALTGLVVLLMPKRGTGAGARVVALVGSLLTFLVTVRIGIAFDAANASFQFIERARWIDEIGASYYLGVDGLSLLLVLLTGLLSPIAILGTAWSVHRRVHAYLAFFMLLEAAMIGVFVALDLLLFYVFWEAMLIPMYFLIGIWGGGRRVYAALKFFLYTMAGSVLMLVAIIFLAFVAADATGSLSFDYFTLKSALLSLGIERWLFLAFAVAFAIKVPLLPFHTWLPDAHVEAPTGGSVILAGVLLKMGTYGFLRFCLPFFPRASVELAPLLAWLAIAGIIYGALMALAQSDLKKLVAYSSVSHLGFVILGLFALNAEGIVGGLLQMVNHGINTGALFLLVGMIYDRTHTRMIGDYGGLARAMPVYSALAMVFVLASIGLPGLNGFAGEFLILLGAFRERSLWGILGALGVVLGAVYMLVMVRRIFFGPVSGASRTARDVTRREVAALVPLALLVVVLGVKPVIFTRLVEPAVAGLLAEMQVRTAELDHFDLDDRQSFLRALASAAVREPQPDGGGAVDEAAHTIAGAP